MKMQWVNLISMFPQVCFLWETHERMGKNKRGVWYLRLPLFFHLNTRFTILQDLHILGNRFTTLYIATIFFHIICFFSLNTWFFLFHFFFLFMIFLKKYFFYFIFNINIVENLILFFFFLFCLSMWFVSSSR